MNVAEAIGRVLQAEGVRVAAGITGQSIGHVADHAGMVRALGVEAERVEEPARLRPALEHAIACVQAGKPAMVEVVTRRVPTSLYRLWEQPA